MSGLDSELRQMAKALRIASLAETTEDAVYTEDGRIEVAVRIIDPPTGEETVAEVAGVDQSRAPKKGEQWIALMVGGSLGECFLVRRIARPGDLVETEPGVYLVDPPKGEDVRIVVRGGAKVVIEAEDIRLTGEDAPMRVALAELVEQVLAERDAKFGTHTHVHPIPLITAGAAPTAPPSPSALGVGNTGSDKIKGS